ncbi:TRAP transporter small permease [Thermodesulfobacteriota bacterium]
MQIKKMARFAENKIYALSRILGIIAIAVLVAMMLFTVLDIFLRAFFNKPIPGDVEIIERSMVFVGFFGLAWCAMRGMHIKVDLVVAFLPKRVQSVIDSFNYILGLGVCTFFTWFSFLEGIANREMNSVTNILRVPLYPFYWIVTFGYGALCLAILVLLARSLKEGIKG